MDEAVRHTGGDLPEAAEQSLSRDDRDLGQLPGARARRGLGRAQRRAALSVHPPPS
jgi:hypothetical protein